ncbi:MAG TPA: TraB/GumN family protein [Anaerolineales bacterium]|nr:TraB/GumN family protein [Anaerolineales bacterium]
MVRGFLVSRNKGSLRMVWTVTKNGLRSYLVGTAHWFPFSFHASLTHLYKQVDTTILEGPLDEASMQLVAEHGRQTDGSASLQGLVTPQAIDLLNQVLGQRLVEQSEGDLSSLFQNISNQHYQTMIEGVRPWMAFFSIWSLYLGWKYSVDMEAYQLACKMGKEVHFLETIAEQLTVLDNIPLEKFVGHLNDVSTWSVYQHQYVDAYLNGELKKLLGLSKQFPTRTPIVLSQRDKVLFERMQPFFSSRPSVAFVGLSHIPGVSELLIENGYEVSQGFV